MTEVLPTFWPDGQRRKAFFPTTIPDRVAAPQSIASSDSESQAACSSVFLPTDHAVNSLSAPDVASLKSSDSMSESSENIESSEGNDDSDTSSEQESLYSRYEHVLDANIYPYDSVFHLTERLTGARRLDELRDMVSQAPGLDKLGTESTNGLLKESNTGGDRPSSLEEITWLNKLIDKVIELLFICNLLTRID